LRRRDGAQFPLGERVQPLGAEKIDLETGQSRQCVEIGVVVGGNRPEVISPSGIIW
jgi:hypothetical protein